MPRSSGNTGNRNNDETINHFGLVRMRINGSGYLKMSLFSLSDIAENELVPFNMDVLTDIEPTRLSNFTKQRCYLDIRVTEINEYFVISKIILFVKPVATSFPGN